MALPGAELVLAPHKMSHYLLRRGITSPADIVNGDLRILDSSRRNCNLVVRTGRDHSFLLKQGYNEHNADTVGHEARIYRFFADLPGSHPLRRFLPTFHDYDAQAGVLALEVLPEAVSLRQSADKRRSCPVRPARELGRALAALHGCDVTSLRADPDVSLPGNPPWELLICRPTLGTYRQSSGAGLQGLRLMQRFDRLQAALDELFDTWEPDALVHNDLRWDNCVRHRRRPGDRSDLKLIDWEFADLGEAAYDVGTVFAEYLSFWLRWVPMSNTSQPGDHLASAAVPLDRIQPSIRAFWESYVDYARLAPPAAGRLLLRAVRFCGVRLIHTAYEQLMGISELSTHAVALLQLADNVLDRPAEASRHVLGLSTHQEVVP
jgi:Phosphotransferase enzyme family